MKSTHADLVAGLKARGHQLGTMIPACAVRYVEAFSGELAARNCRVTLVGPRVTFLMFLQNKYQLNERVRFCVVSKVSQSVACFLWLCVQKSLEE